MLEMRTEALWTEQQMLMAAVWMLGPLQIAVS